MTSVPFADVPQAIHDAFSALTQWLSHLSVADWILIGVAVGLVLWAWIRAVAFSRLGTIEITQFACDDAILAPAARKAELQTSLGDRGLLPPSSVPSGSPTADKLAAAIGEAPLPQAKWLAALVGLLPIPPSSTGFKVTGTLAASSHTPPLSLLLPQLDLCLGPQKGVRLGGASGASWPVVMEEASKDMISQNDGVGTGYLPQVGAVDLS